RKSAGGGENAVFDNGGIVCMTGCVLLAHRRHKWDWGAAELLAITLLPVLELRESFQRIYPAAAAMLIIDPETGALSRTSASFLLSFQAHIMGILSVLAQALVQCAPRPSLFLPRLAQWKGWAARHCHSSPFCTSPQDQCQLDGRSARAGCISWLR